MAEQVTMQTLVQLTHDWEGKQATLAQLDTDIASKTQQIVEIDQRIQASGAYESALAIRIAEMRARVDVLRRETTPEEMALRTRLVDLKEEIDRFEYARSEVTRAHYMELEEAAAMIRRQRSGNLEPSFIPRPEADAQAHAAAHIAEREAGL